VSKYSTASLSLSLCEDILKTNQRSNAREISANKNLLLQHRCLVSPFVPVLADTRFGCFFLFSYAAIVVMCAASRRPSLPLLRCDTLLSFCLYWNSHYVLHSRELRIFQKCIQTSLSHSCERIRHCVSRINSRKPHGITYAVFSKGNKQLLRSKRVLKQEQWESSSSRDMPVATNITRSSLSSRRPAGRYETMLFRLWEFGGFKHVLPVNFPVVI
jgi:hypothetical protein